MNKNNIEIIKALYEAFAKRDVPTILELVHPEVTVSQTELLPWGGTYQGTKGLHAFFEQLFDRVESMVEPEEFVDAGERIVMFGKTRGRVKTNDQPFDIRAVHIWTLKDGKGIRFEPNVDTPAMLKALNEIDREETKLDGASKKTSMGTSSSL